MKKQILLCAMLFAAIVTTNAQTNWTTNLMSLETTNEARLGTSNKYPLNLYTNGVKRAIIDTTGFFRPLFPIRFGGDNDSNIYISYKSGIGSGEPQNGPPVIKFGPHNPVTNPDEPIDLTCVNGTFNDGKPDMAVLFRDLISVEHNPPVPNGSQSNPSGGNIVMGHNGSNAFIESQGTTELQYHHSGDLFINGRCKRNIFLFTDTLIPFKSSWSPFMSVGGGGINVAGILQLAGSTPSFAISASSVPSPSNAARMFVYAYNQPANGIIIRHSHGSYEQSAGVKFIEKNDNDRAIMVNKASISNMGDDGTTNFIVYGSGKTVVGVQSGSSNNALLNVNVNGGNAIDVFDQASNKVNFRVKANGYAYAREINVLPTNLNFPDYVFEKNYKLYSLNDLEKYVYENKHLPNIPTAAQVNEEGINVAEMQVKQMEKLEEAFLYIIQLKKENDILRNRLDKLENK